MSDNKPKPIFDAGKYASFRPSYPKELFQCIYESVQQFDTAWDCGCGTGQATIILAESFKKVVATDMSEGLIDQAPWRDNIRYLIESAESTNLSVNSIDLITVAQAMHWFKPEAFGSEVRRVLKPGGVLAAWCYGLAEITPAVDAVVRELASVTLKDYWPEGREHIEQQYAHYPFALPVKYRETFVAKKVLSLDGLLGYLQSWSPRANYLEQHGVDVIEEHRLELTEAWGEAGVMHEIATPIHLVVGVK